MNEKLPYHLADLEYVLSVHLRPCFLTIVGPAKDDPSDDTIDVIISCVQFKGKTIQKRIASVFSLIIKYIPGIMEEYNVIVQTFDGEEIEMFLEHVFEEDEKQQ